MEHNVSDFKLFEVRDIWFNINDSSAYRLTLAWTFVITRFPSSSDIFCNADISRERAWILLCIEENAQDVYPSRLRFSDMPENTYTSDLGKLLISFKATPSVQRIRNFKFPNDIHLSGVLFELVWKVDLYKKIVSYSFISFSPHVSIVFFLITTTLMGVTATG